VKRMILRGRSYSTGPLVMSLVALVTACALVLLPAGCSLGSSASPDLTGKTLDEATKLADGAGLKLVQSEEVPYFLPAGTVMAQDPLPGIKSADGTIKVTKVQIESIKASDPDGDGIENNAQLPHLYDGDLTTSWSTETTYKSPDFQGLGGKTGVGLLFTLAEGATMVKIDYTLMGWKGEVQKLNADKFAIAVAPLGETQQVSWNEPLTSGRIWFYRLAALPMSADNIQRYGVIVNEISFYK
jgi:hypothetical protein